jgi:hypothetical protein
MWPFLHKNKHNTRTWTEVNERKTLAENLNDVQFEGKHPTDCSSR